MSRRKRNNNTRFSLFAFQDIITCVMGIMLLLTLLLCLQITAEVASAEQSSAAEMVRQMQQQAAALSAEVAELEQSVDEQLTLLNSGAINDAELLRNRSLTLDRENQLATEDLRALWQQSADDEAVLTRLQAQESERIQQQQQTESLQQQNQLLQSQLEQLKAGDRIVYNAHDSNSKTCWLVELEDTSTMAVAELGKTQKPQTFSTLQDLTNWISGRHQTGAVFMFLVKPAAADLLEPLTEELRQQKVSFGFDLMAQEKTALDPIKGASVL